MNPYQAVAVSGMPASSQLRPIVKGIENQAVASPVRPHVRSLVEVFDINAHVNKHSQYEQANIVRARDEMETIRMQNNHDLERKIHDVSKVAEANKSQVSMPRPMAARKGTCHADDSMHCDDTATAHVQREVGFDATINQVKQLKHLTQTQEVWSLSTSSQSREELEPESRGKRTLDIDFLTNELKRGAELACKHVSEPSTPTMEIPVALFDKLAALQLQNFELQQKDSEIQTTLHEMENKVKEMKKSNAVAVEVHAKRVAELQNIANAHAKYNCEANTTIFEMKQSEMKQRMEFDNLEARQQSAAHFQPKVVEIQETIRNDTLRIERLKQGMASNTPYSVQSMELEDIALDNAKHNLELGSLIEEIDKSRSHYLKQISELGALTRVIQEMNQPIQMNMAHIEQIKNLHTTTKLTHCENATTKSTNLLVPQRPLFQYASKTDIHSSTSHTTRSSKQEFYGAHPQQYQSNQKIPLQRVPQMLIQQKGSLFLGSR